MSSIYFKPERRRTDEEGYFFSLRRSKIIKSRQKAGRGTLRLLRLKRRKKRIIGGLRAVVMCKKDKICRNYPKTT